MIEPSNDERAGQRDTTTADALWKLVDCPRCGAAIERDVKSGKIWQCGSWRNRSSSGALMKFHDTPQCRVRSAESVLKRIASHGTLTISDALEMRQLAREALAKLTSANAEQPEE